MKILTIFLRFTLCIMLFLVTVIGWDSFPALIGFLNESHVSYLILVPFAVLLYASSAFTYCIIFFAWRLLYLTDHHRLLTRSGIFAVRIIKISFYSIAVIYILAIFGLIAEARILEAPAPLVVELFLIILGLTIGVFANTLEKIMKGVSE